MSTTKTTLTVKQSPTKILCEGAISLALALVFSYIKVPLGLSFGGFGGSIDVVMCPLIFFAIHYGISWGMLCGLAFGTLKYFFAEGFGVNWTSILLDYAVAYAFVGLAGLFRGKYHLIGRATFVGCLGRFFIHFLSGMTVYAQYMPEAFLGHSMTSPIVYSLLYNGTYMLPNTILAILLCISLRKPMEKLWSV